MRLKPKRSHRSRVIIALATIISLAVPIAWAEDKEPDLALGKQLNRQCALCHGLHSQGILGGTCVRRPVVGEMALVRPVPGLDDRQGRGRCVHHTLRGAAEVHRLEQSVPPAADDHQVESWARPCSASRGSACTTSVCTASAASVLSGDRCVARTSLLRLFTTVRRAISQPGMSPAASWLDLCGPVSHSVGTVVLQLNRG